MSNRQQQVPPPPPRETLKLARLWAHFPATARRELLTTATRILQTHVLAAGGEVSHDRS